MQIYQNNYYICIMDVNFYKAKLIKIIDTRNCIWEIHVLDVNITKKLKFYGLKLPLIKSAENKMAAEVMKQIRKLIRINEFYTVRVIGDCFEVYSDLGNVNDIIKTYKYW